MNCTGTAGGGLTESGQQVSGRLERGGRPGTDYTETTNEGEARPGSQTGGRLERGDRAEADGAE